MRAATSPAVGAVGGAGANGPVEGRAGVRSHVALLRGINVGGRNKVAMADLRRIVASLGHTDVMTYIQSGNVAFAAANPDDGADELAGGLEAAIATALSVRPAVVVVSRDHLRRVVRGNPFPDEPNHKAVHVVFFPAPHPTRSDALAGALERAHAKGSRDEARVAGRTLYLWTPDGLGRSKLAEELSRADARSGGATAGTARNWATVLALVELLDG